MSGFFSNLFKLQDKVNFEELLQNGAILVDVRTREEYQSGHAKEAVNMPLDKLSALSSQLPADRPIITVCQSGTRSKSAVSQLKSKGFKEVYNGGGWFNFK